MSVNASAASALLAAQEILSVYGFCQGMHREERTGKLDTHGAILRSVGVQLNKLNDHVEDFRDYVPQHRRPAYLVAMDAIYDTIFEIEPDYEGDLAAWNDKPGRTLEEVKRMLQRASDRLRIAA